MHGNRIGNTNMMGKRLWVLVMALGTFSGLPAYAETELPATMDIKRMSMDTALRMASAAVERCRTEGLQVGVTVVDRGGHPQVVLRDVLAMDLTLEMSRKKAYTAMSFNAPTSQLSARAASPLASHDALMFSGGGLPVTAAGSIIGGIGVSGAPSGEVDEICARAGIEAVAEDLEWGDM